MDLVLTTHAKKVRAKIFVCNKRMLYLIPDSSSAGDMLVQPRQGAMSPMFMQRFMSLHVMPGRHLAARCRAYAGEKNQTPHYDFILVENFID